MPNAEMLKQRMAQKGLRQKDIAEALCIAAPTVSQKINGIRPLDLREAETLAELLDIDAGEFGEYLFMTRTCVAQESTTATA